MQEEWIKVVLCKNKSINCFEYSTWMGKLAQAVMLLTCIQVSGLNRGQGMKYPVFVAFLISEPLQAYVWDNTTNYVMVADLRILTNSLFTYLTVQCCTV